MRPSLLIAALLVVAACSSTPKSEYLPTPYTAAEIREGNPEGTELIFRQREPGGPWRIQMLRFASTDEDGAVVEKYVTDDRGDVQDQAIEVDASSWDALRDHALFRREGASRTASDCVVPAGRFDCWLYTVVGEGSSVSRFYFALDRPGPPVRLETSVSGETVFEMELVEASVR